MNNIDLIVAKGWDDYQLLDSGNGRRLEKFGAYILNRPDPDALWIPKLPKSEWEKAHAVFGRLANGRDDWQRKTAIPEKWLMKYRSISFYAKLSPFKHTGVFPEQSVQWDWMEKLIYDAKKETHILNLFAYTGIASLVCASAGAKVTHVDASSSTIGWARENQAVSGLAEKPIRWIFDDVLKFITREVRRGVKYDGIIMDPPIYGHGPKGEVWDFHKHFPELLTLCKQILSDNLLFILINAYAISASSLMLKNVLIDYAPVNGSLTNGELVIEEQSAKRLLSTGIFSRWSSL